MHILSSSLRERKVPDTSYPQLKVTPFTLSLLCVCVCVYTNVFLCVFVCEGIVGSADWVVCLCSNRQRGSFSMVQIG